MAENLEKSVRCLLHSKLEIPSPSQLQGLKVFARRHLS